MRHFFKFSLLWAAALGALAWSQTPADASMSLESLMQTKVVTASRFAEDLTDAPGVVSVVTRAEMDRYGGLTLREILNRVSGLSLASSVFGDRTILSMRGEQTKDNGAHVLFLINGRPTREVLQGGVMTELLEAFPVGILERLEVIEGPGSVLYGSNAYSGVINLITRKVEGRAGAIRGLGSGAGANGGAAEGWFARGELKLSAAAQFHQDSRWNTPIWPDLGRGLTLPVQSFSVYDRSRGVFAEAEYRGFSAMFSTMDHRSPYEIVGYSGEARWHRTFADLGYDLKPRKNWDMGLHATYSKTGVDSTTFPLTARNSGELELNWTNSINVSERTQVTFGALYGFQHGLEIDNFGVAFTATDATRANGGLYGQIEYRLMDGLRLIGGVQTNKVANIPIHSVPRAGLLWSPVPRWHVKALYGEAFRAPSLNEVRTQYTPVEGNANLRAELSSTLDLGLIYQTRSLRSSFNYFRSKQTNTIVAVKNGVLPDGLETFQYQNVDGLLFHGVQWEAKWYVLPRLLLEASALYQTNRDSRGHRTTLPTPEFGAKAGASFADKHGWTFGVFDVYSESIPGFSKTPNPRPGPQHLLTSNIRLNLGKYFGTGARHMALFAHGDNLAGRTVWLPAWGFTSAGTLPFSRARSFYYGIEFSFQRE